MYSNFQYNENNRKLILQHFIKNLNRTNCNEIFYIDNILFSGICIPKILKHYFTHTSSTRNQIQIQYKNIFF